MAWSTGGADQEADFEASRLPDSRQRARTGEESRGESGYDGGGRRWAAAVAAAAALLLVRELVGGGDCGRAHRGESALPSRRAAHARAAGARISPGAGRAARPPRASSPPATSGRARAPRRSAVPRLLACSSRRFSFPVFSPWRPRAAALTSTRTRAHWRTRTLGLLSPLEPLSSLRVLLPREGGSVASWGREEAPPTALLSPSSGPWVMSYLGKVLDGFPHAGLVQACAAAAGQAPRPSPESPEMVPLVGDQFPWVFLSIFFPFFFVTDQGEFFL